MTEPELNILLSLAEGTRHGYRMMQEVGERTGGRFAMGAGTVYGALKRSRSRGLIEEADRRGPSGPDARQRYYRITEPGTRALVDEITRMQDLVRAAHAIIRPGSEARRAYESGSSGPTDAAEGGRKPPQP